MATMQYAVIHGQLRHWTIDTGVGEPTRKELMTLPAVLNELAREGWEVFWITEGGGEQTVFLRRPMSA
jgi:hypothetical protein